LEVGKYKIFEIPISLLGEGIQGKAGLFHDRNEYEVPRIFEMLIIQRKNFSEDFFLALSMQTMQKKSSTQDRSFACKNLSVIAQAGSGPASNLGR